MLSLGREYTYVFVLSTQSQLEQVIDSPLLLATQGCAVIFSLSRFNLGQNRVVPCNPFLTRILYLSSSLLLASFINWPTY
jgi:hypothetical protein